MLEGRAPELKPENLTFNIELLGGGGGFENNCVSKWPREAHDRRCKRCLHSVLARVKCCLIYSFNSTHKTLKVEILSLTYFVSVSIHTSE